jgi:pseudouridylate synthase
LIEEAPVQEYICIADDVRKALSEGKAVVALESTIIAHGMPYPTNVLTAREVEQIVRQTGAVPATIALINGKIQVGLSDRELEEFGQAKGIAKASRRDVPMFLAQGKPAATTVSATMLGAALAGINVFATGGIGGVHRGAQETFDISSDLTELARTPVAVVSAGAKAILDLPLTLEYLETLGVPVIGFRSSEFPAFFSRTSGLHLSHSVEDPSSLARVMKTMWGLGYVGGLLIANPIPPENAIDGAVIKKAIDRALEEMTDERICGAAVTPFLLKRVVEATEGKSLQANIALVKNNAKLAGEIAVAFSSM